MIYGFGSEETAGGHIIVNFDLETQCTVQPRDTGLGKAQRQTYFKSATPE